MHIAQSLKALLVTAALTLPTMAFAADPAMMKDGMMVDHKGMTVVHLRQGHRRQVDVHRRVRRKLATAEGPGGRQGRRQMDRHQA